MNSKGNSFKAFSIPHEAWYRNTISEKPYIRVGEYYDYGGCAYEFKFVWDDIGIKLEIYNDAWIAFCKMPELVDLMNKIQTQKFNPTIEEFSKMLKDIGFKDITSRKEPEM